MLKRSWAGEVRNVSLRDRRERGRLSGDSRHLRGGEGRQDWLERVPQASQGTRVEGYPADHLGCLEAAVEETLSYYAFPEEHWRWVRTNNPLERILREIRRRTRVVGAFPDGQSALNLAAARLRHIAGTAWSTKRYLNIELLKDQMRGVVTA